MVPETPQARPSRRPRAETPLPPPPPGAADDTYPPPPDGDGDTAASADRAARPARPSIPWGPAVRTGALGFSVVLFLYALLVVITGTVYRDSAYAGNNADELHRVGLVASQAIDLKFAVGLVLAALLIALAASLNGSDWLPFVAAILVALGCLFGLILSYLVYRYQVHNLTVQRPVRARTTAFDLGLYTYMLSTAGTSVVAFFVALPSLIAGMRPRPAATATDQATVDA